jgi:deazaflavin-dependent oxidoreductase (nitroreductase family)
MLFGEEHAERYVETGGDVGHEWQPGVYTLLLITRGRQSGRPRVAPLIYRTDGDAYVIVASKGGSDVPPAWYLNLVANPDVEIQVEDRRLRARARDAEGEERERLWKLMAEVWPQYDDYQRKTDRQIPVVVLDPVDEDG